MCCSPRWISCDDSAVALNGDKIKGRIARRETL